MKPHVSNKHGPDGVHSADLTDPKAPCYTVGALAATEEQKQHEEHHRECSVALVKKKKKKKNSPTA